LLTEYIKSVMAYCRLVDTARASCPTQTRLDVGPEQKYVRTATKPRIIFGQVYSKRSIVFMMKSVRDLAADGNAVGQFNVPVLRK
jgi:hypothetical protein